MLLAELGFEVERAVIAEGGVQAPAVVEALDIREDGGGSLLPGGTVAAVDKLVLQGAPERLHGGPLFCDLAILFYQERYR